MDLYKPIFSNVIKPWWLKYKQQDHLKYLPELEDFHRKTIEEIRQYQLAKFQGIIAEAYAFVPFYRREWDEIGITPQDIKTFNDIKKIPILTKDKLRACTNDFISTKANRAALIVSGTGGTTDSPIQLMYDNERLLYKTAEMDFFRRWWNWELGDKVAYLWGAPQDIPNLKSAKWRILNTLLGRKLFMFSSLLDDAIMEEYIQKINRFKPGILQGYTNPAYILSQYILKKQPKIHRPKSVILTAEPCHSYQRESIEKAFDAPVYTFYGCREAGYAGVECGEHDGYHMNCSSLYTEVVRENSDAQAGEMGSIIFTDLLNTKMPFIRYKIGDLGITDGTPCPCGSSLPKMKFFAGRETDVFVTPDGKFIPGVSLCDRVIEDCEGIRALQFIQDAPEKLTVKIVKGAKFKEEDIINLDRRIASYFKGVLLVSKVFVDEIPKEKSGKTRFCICNVPKEL